MIDAERQIEYWRSGALDDIETARVLIDKNRLVHGLFFCHLVIEKIVKAHVVKYTNDIAPRSHNLIHLSEKANLIFREEDEILLGILMKYQLQGRYPDYNPIPPNKDKAIAYLLKTERLLAWLKAKL